MLLIYRDFDLKSLMVWFLKPMWWFLDKVHQRLIPSLFSTILVFNYWICFSVPSLCRFTIPHLYPCPQKKLPKILDSLNDSLCFPFFYSFCLSEYFVEDRMRENKGTLIQAMLQGLPHQQSFDHVDNEGRDLLWSQVVVSFIFI